MIENTENLLDHKIGNSGQNHAMNNVDRSIKFSL